MIRLKYLLLPIAGALSALLSFLFAAPYVSTLHRTGLKAGDPLLQTTFGTTWSNVQHATFGIFLCGSFCFILEAGRRSWVKVTQSTVIGMIVGGIANSIADSGSDYIGLASSRTMGMAGSFVGVGAWFILVPFALAISTMLGIGLTKQRFGRALYATMVAAIYTFFAKIAGMIVVAAMSFSTMKAGDILGGNVVSSLEKNVPAFLIEAVMVGVALGLTMARADKISRAGSLRLVYGRKEFKDWSLDHALNRIGSGEVEIPVRGFKGVEPVHACIFRQESQFILDCQHFPGFVNGFPVSQALLNNGDTIQIGEAQLVFYSRGAVKSRPAVPALQQMIQPVLQATAVNSGTGSPIGDPLQIPFPQNVAPATTAPVPNHWLIDLAGKEFPLQEGVNSIGREVGNSICFPQNSTVSRSHAQIMIDQTGAYVSDLGSANGSGVNGMPVTSPMLIKDGDTLDFGSARLRYRSD